MNAAISRPVFALLLLTLCACAGKSARPGGSADGAAGTEGDSSRIAPHVVGGLPERSGGGSSNSRDADRVIYFDYDAATLKPESLRLIERWSEQLRQRSAQTVRLEGYTDERGSRAYNIGLGERRANAVRDALVTSGVEARQLTLVSFGEEKPVDAGHGEAAWARNRRVEIVD